MSRLYVAANTTGNRYNEFQLFEDKSLKDNDTEAESC
jgi:hypothetical protein